MFLSCLRGSEPVRVHAHARRNFLSCLRGSELDEYDGKYLMVW
jgi:hypothetical protein